MSSFRVIEAGQRREAISRQDVCRQRVSKYVQNLFLADNGATMVVCLRGCKIPTLLPQRRLSLMVQSGRVRVETLHEIHEVAFSHILLCLSAIRISDRGRRCTLALTML